MQLKKLKKFLIEGLCGFGMWSTLLTPYTWFVMHTSLAQYEAWLIMEAVIVPPIAVLVVNVTNKVVRRFVK